jgi:LPXTG-motif cell wall-anchored protein
VRKASGSSSGRRLASITTGVIAALLLSVFTFGGQAGAWVNPTLSANCAPDATHFSWTINLHTEANQNIEMSWGTGAFTTFMTKDFVSAGAHTFLTARGGTALTVRYASDHNSKTSATANSNLCGTGTTTGECTLGVAKVTSNSEITATQGGVATVSFTMGKGCTGQELSLVSYKAPSDTFSRETAAEQVLFDSKTGVFGDQTAPHTFSLTVNVPSCFFQVDFVKGKPIMHLGPAGSTNFYSDQGRLLAAVNGGMKSCSTGTGTTEVPPTNTTPPTTVVPPAGEQNNVTTTPPPAVAGVQTPPSVGAVTPIIEIFPPASQQAPAIVTAPVANGQLGVQTSPVSGVQSLPSTSTESAPTFPLAAVGLVMMALGGALLRRRDAQV